MPDDTMAFSTSWQSQLGFGLVALAAYLFYSLARNRSHQKLLQQLPIADVTSGDWKAAILQTSTKHPDTPWRLPSVSDEPRVILPNQTMDEIRFLPDDRVSLRKEVFKKLHGRWTDIGRDHPVGIAAIKTDLTNNVNRMLPLLQEECIYALYREFGHIDDNWTKVSLYGNLLQIAALVNGRMFVGLPLCREQAWIDLNIQYTMDVVQTIAAVQKIHPLLRRIKAPFLTQVKKVEAHKKNATAMLKPHIEKVIEAKEEAGLKKDRQRLTFNLISWMLDQMETPDFGLLASEQIFGSFGAIHATCITLTNALFDLAAWPEYVPELRAEICDVLSKEPDRVLRKTAVPKLIKLDSFLRESGRMNPVTLTSVTRVVTARNGIKLSTGHTIPHKTSIGFVHATSPFVHPSSSVTLPTDLVPSQPPLSQFYPFRYSELRALPGQTHLHQFAMTANDNINFGHGPSACPGRFFAGAEIKVILAEILRRFDLALGPNGEKNGDGEFVRPKNIVDPGTLQQLPDFTKMIYFKALPEVLPAEDMVAAE